MSSAELHSLISQLQSDGNDEFEYEADIGKLAKDRTRNTWYDDTDAGRKIVAAPPNRLPYVPEWDVNSEIKTPEGVLIPKFETQRTSMGYLDFGKYPDRASLLRVFQYSLVDTNMHISDLHKQINELRKKIHEMKKNHTHADGGKLFTYNGTHYVPVNGTPHKKKKNISEARKAKNALRITKLKALKAQKKAEKDAVAASSETYLPETVFIPEKKAAGTALSKALNKVPRGS